MLGDVARFSELRQRLAFLIGALVVYRIGTFIPVPGIDPVALEQFFNDQSGTILSMFNMYSGGALRRMSIFALGVMPYISASIIIQMATHVVPSLGQLRKEGESGRRKITQYTRYGTVILSSFQAMAAAAALESQQVVLNPGLPFVITAAVTLVTGRHAFFECGLITGQRTRGDEQGDQHHDNSSNTLGCTHGNHLQGSVEGHSRSRSCPVTSEPSVGLR